MEATAGIKSAEIQAVVLRAVPCGEHIGYTLGCPDCLTGEQAHELSIAKTHDLGTISSSTRLWNIFGRRLSERRINKANRETT